MKEALLRYFLERLQKASLFSISSVVIPETSMRLPRYAAFALAAAFFLSIYTCCDSPGCSYNQVLMATDFLVDALF